MILFRQSSLCCLPANPSVSSRLRASMPSASTCRHPYSPNAACKLPAMEYHVMQLAAARTVFAHALNLLSLPGLHVRTALLSAPDPILLGLSGNRDRETWFKAPLRSAHCLFLGRCLSGARPSRLPANPAIGAGSSCRRLRYPPSLLRPHANSTPASMLAWNLRRATPSSPPPGKLQAQGPTSPPTAHSETEAWTIPTLGIAATDTHACNRDIFPFLLKIVKQSLFAGLFPDFQKKGKMGVWSGVGLPSF